VGAVLEHGNFTSADTIAVWLGLAFLSMGLLPVTSARLLANRLYALDASPAAHPIAVWLPPAFLSMGLLPVTSARLLQNGLYALDDARTPARLGVVGVVLAGGFGVGLMFPLDRLFVGPDGIGGWDHIFTFGPLPPALRENVAGIPRLGIVGLAIGATISDWIDYRALNL